VHLKKYKGRLTDANLSEDDGFANISEVPIGEHAAGSVVKFLTQLQKDTLLVFPDQASPSTVSCVQNKPLLVCASSVRGFF
jgi:hypothetical protein